MTRFRCPFCVLSKKDNDEKYDGEAVQKIKDHLRDFHERNDMDDKIVEINR